MFEKVLFERSAGKIPGNLAASGQPENFSNQELSPGSVDFRWECRWGCKTYSGGQPPDPPFRKGGTNLLFQCHFLFETGTRI